MSAVGDELRDLVVVGAGAAGLWAARRAASARAELGRAPDVLLLEKTPRAGTKVLASGGTRCNLTTTLGPAAAARLFGLEGERFLRTAFRALPPEAVRAHFREWGVPTVEAPLEKVFPASGSARDVQLALERSALAAGVELRSEARVRGVERAGDRWRVELEGGRAVAARRLLLSPGGRSYPRTGTTGDGYAWLESLGLELVPPAPALAPLLSPEPWVHELTGIAVQDAVVRLRGPDGRVLAERARPVLFTHHGLSGPGPMDVSRCVARAAASGATTGFAVELDLLPARSREELTALLRDAASRPGSPAAASLFADVLPRRLLAAVLRAAGLEAGVRANALPRAGRHALVEALKALRVPVSGTAGYEKAEVTAGGLALSELDPGTLRVRRHEDLWVFGELIDLDGPIGGLNFQAAFATAELAGRDAGR